jgi:hypothetical protein
VAHVFANYKSNKYSLRIIILPMEFEVKIVSYDPGKSEDVPTPVEKQYISKGMPKFNVKEFRGKDYAEIKNVECSDGLKWQICITIDNNR